MSPTSTQYETASQGRSSGRDSLHRHVSTSGGDGTSSQLSFDTATLQPETPTNLEAFAEDGDISKRDQLDISEVSHEAHDDTVSRTLSEGSYISAQSENEEFGLVDLHMQVDKPITESPLLMSSYISHLTQLRCSNWNAYVPPLPYEVDLRILA